MTTTAAGTDTGRKHMGGGEFLSKAAPPFSFLVESQHEKPHWRSHDPGDQVRAAFAGTPVVIDGDIYEVAQHQLPDPTKGSREHRYFLQPWDDSHPLRGPYSEYSIETLRAERAAVKQAHQQGALGTRLHLFGVLVALLPARDQQRLYQDYGFDAVFWTRWSAVVCTFLWFAAGIVTIRDIPTAPSELLALLVIAVFLIEQFFRRARAMNGEPCGSMLGYVLRVLLPRSMRARER